MTWCLVILLLALMRRLRSALMMKLLRCLTCLTLPGRRKGVGCVPQVVANQPYGTAEPVQICNCNCKTHSVLLQHYKCTGRNTHTPLC